MTKLEFWIYSINRRIKYFGGNATLNVPSRKKIKSGFRSEILRLFI